MIVTVPGGQVSVNGATVTLEVLGRAKSRDGAELLFFLSRDVKPHAFEFVGGPAGASRWVWTDD
jgi:hypothetical protein